MSTRSPIRTPNMGVFALSIICSCSVAAISCQHGAEGSGSGGGFGTGGSSGATGGSSGTGGNTSTASGGAPSLGSGGAGTNTGGTLGSGGSAGTGDAVGTGGIGGSTGAGSGGQTSAGSGGAAPAGSGGATGGASATAGRGGTGTGGGAAAGGSTGRGLHVNGKFLNDGDGKQVTLRGPELVIRWGEYSGLTALGVDVPWQGDKNNSAGATTIAEMAKTKANAIRLYGGLPNELDALLNAAIVQQKMFVGVGRIDWTNSQIISTLKKYANYLILHPRGEFTHRDASLWRTEALKVVKEIRALGYTSPIEIGTTGYGQTWPTLSTYGKEVADSDPLKNTLFLLQLYSEHASDITGTLDKVAAFASPVNVGSCLFNEGITDNYGNNSTTYRNVWDETFKRSLSSFYWDWWGDGNGNSMTSNGSFSNLNGIGQYVVNDSPAALKNMTKTPYLLNAAVAQ